MLRAACLANINFTAVVTLKFMDAIVFTSVPVCSIRYALIYDLLRQNPDVGVHTGVTMFSQTSASSNVCIWTALFFRYAISRLGIHVKISSDTHALKSRQVTPPVWNISAFHWIQTLIIVGSFTWHFGLKYEIIYQINAIEYTVRCSKFWFLRQSTKCSEKHKTSKFNELVK